MFTVGKLEYAVIGIPAAECVLLFKWDKKKYYLVTVLWGDGQRQTIHF